MISVETLTNCQTADFLNCDTSVLVDLRSIKIDSSAPLQDRVISFVEQVHNPYLFKVGDITVKVNYGVGKQLSEALVSLLQKD